MKKVVLFLIVLFCVTACSVKKIEEQTDAEKFAIEFNISKNNPFHYVTIDEVLKLFSSGNGIVFLGNSDGEWSKLCATILNDALSKTEVEYVSYFNLKVAEEKYPKRYRKLKYKIEESLKKDEKLQTPALFFLKDGKVVSYSLDYEDITKGNEEGNQKKEQKKLKNKYIQLIKEYQKKDV